MIDMNIFLFGILILVFIIYWIGVAFVEINFEYNQQIRRKKKQLRNLRKKD